MFKADRKRAHHNALERKRRDHIKDSFHTLRDAIPNIKGEKVSVSVNMKFFLLQLLFHFETYFFRFGHFKLTFFIKKKLFKFSFDDNH